MPGSPTTVLRRYGTADVEPDRQTHRIGNLSFEWQRGALRYGSIDSIEIVRGLSVVIRDANWGTHELVALTDYVTARDDRLVCGYQAYLPARDDNPEPRLTVDLQIDVDSFGLDARLQLTAGSRFTTCRSGLVLLLPLSGVVEHEVAVTHSDHSIETGVFPRLISPSQPFFDIRGLAFSPAGRERIDVVFDGDVFEMEDQRNWSDASFKIYNRPLARPSPYCIEAGETVEQRIRIQRSDAGARP